MARSAAQLEADITALENALYVGELMVRFADRTIQYRSVAEIERALQLARSQLAKAQGTRRRVYRLDAEKGFD